MEPLLSVENLRTYFYLSRGVVKAVDGVSFNIMRDEVFSLVGETGCGKSVTALSILRLIGPPGKIVSGKVMFEGRNLLELSEADMRKIRGKEIAMIFQNPMTSLNPILTVGFQIGEPLMAHFGEDKKSAISKAIKLIRRVKIPDPDIRARYYPHQFSGGMRQRALIAMMISCRPKLLIADEPTTALDVTIQAQILDLLMELKKDYKTSMLMITHDFGVVAEMSDRVGVMYLGNIVEMGEVEEVFKNPLHPYTKGLIACLPLKPERKKKLEHIPGVLPSPINPPRGCKFHPRCKYAMDICRKKPPETIDLGGHIVACHMYSR